MFFMLFAKERRFKNFEIIFIIQSLNGGHFINCILPFVFGITFQGHCGGYFPQNVLENTHQRHCGASFPLKCP
jgi:hypothetical protein